MVSKKNTDLHQLLYEWKGTHVDYLISIYQSFIEDDGFLDTLIELYLSDKSLGRATTWLIKHHYDKGNRLAKDQILKILSAVNDLEHWESKLHVLQLVPHFQIDREISENIEPFVQASIQSEKKFVKAAAYTAYFEIVKNIPELRNELRLLCDRALETESASVKSKVRKIVKQLEKETG